MREACSSRWKLPLSSDDTLHLPLRLPKSYDNSREILGWVSRRWLYNIPRSLETRGYRPLGRVALVDHTLQVLAILDKKLAQLAHAMGGDDAASEKRNEKVRVVLLAGTGGGTGAGIAIDVANAVRSLAANRSLGVEVQGFLVCTCFATGKFVAAGRGQHVLSALGAPSRDGTRQQNERRHDALQRVRISPGAV